MKIFKLCIGALLGYSIFYLGGAFITQEFYWLSGITTQSSWERGFIFFTAFVFTLIGIHTSLLYERSK